MAQNRIKRNIKAALEETGFGSKSFSDIDRLILEDGSFNVTKKGAGFKGFSFYYWLLNLHWIRLLLYGIIGYFIVNLLFACCYYIAGPEQLTGGLEQRTAADLFMHCFYFSTQTLTTVGYGFISPVKGTSSMIAAFEAMLGLLGFALATSVLYGRFSKAKSRILFSKNMVVSPYQGIRGLKFRIANPRKSQIIELKVRVLYSHLEFVEGISKRRYTPLDLEISFIDMFPLPWTIVHPLDENSPLKGKSQADLEREQTEFIIILKGYDDTFNQYVHQINSYRANEVLFNADFEPMFDTSYETSTTVLLDKISDTKKA
ncbi:MAG: ion channel [Ekhidna sp.]